METKEEVLTLAIDIPKKDIDIFTDSINETSGIELGEVIDLKIKDDVEKNVRVCIKIDTSYDTAICTYILGRTYQCRRDSKLFLKI